MPNPLKFLIFFIVVVGAGWLLLSHFEVSAGLTRNVIYQPSKDIKDVTLDGLPPGGTVETVRTADGLDLKGIVYRGDGDGDLYLVFHGNASSANGTAQWLKGLTEGGGTVIFAEYRGYSGNPGRPSEKGTALDAAAFADLAFKIAMKEHHSQRVIYVGHSLGGGVAFQAAERAVPYALVTIGTFTDTRSLAPKLARSMVADRYENKAKVASLKSDYYYILHGTHDEVIPLAHAKSLFEAAEQAGKSGGAFVFEGEGHAPDGTKVLQAIGYATTSDLKEGYTMPDWQGVKVMRFRKNVAAPAPKK